MKALVQTLLLASAVVAACAEAPTDPGLSSLQAGPGAARATAKDSVRVAMTVADGGTYAIQGDGLGEYIDGRAGIRAVIDAFGNLQITPANAGGTAPAERRLNVTYAPGQRWTFPNQVNFKVKSNRTNNGNPRIQDMVVGSALCYNVTIAHQDGDFQYVNTYNPAAYPSTSYALISRTSATTWTVASHGTATTGLHCGAADIAWVTGTDLSVKRGGGFTVGAVAQAFSLDLRALP